jgi:hypothetical protein
VLVYTHDRIDDARVNLEIIRHHWSTHPMFATTRIVHATNGKQSWYPNATIEDVLVRRRNTGHFRGASELIDAGIATFQKKYPDIDELVVLAADTWLLNPAYLAKIIDAMDQKGQVLATCPWGLPNRDNLWEVGLAIDFFIVNMAWARRSKMFPLAYQRFYDSYGEFLLYQRGSQVMPEKVLLLRFVQALRRQGMTENTSKIETEARIYRLRDREPVHTHEDLQGLWIRRVEWKKMGLTTSHDPTVKKKFLQQFRIRGGKNIRRLLQSSDLGYYNQHSSTSQYR